MFPLVSVPASRRSAVILRARAYFNHFPEVIIETSPCLLKRSAVVCVLNFKWNAVTLRVRAYFNHSLKVVILRARAYFKTA